MDRPAGSKQSAEPAESTQSAELAQVVVRQRRTRRRTERRWILLLATAMPILLIAAIFSEDAGLPNFTPGYDLSEPVIRWTAGISALGGLAIIVYGLRHGVRGLYPVSRGPGQWRRAIRRAREQRLRAAARMVAGALITFFGLAVLIARLGAA